MFLAFFLFFLAGLFALAAVRRAWRAASMQVIFAGAGSDHAGLVAVVWLRPGHGERWLWLPRSLSRRLWLAHACGSGRLFALAARPRRALKFNAFFSVSMKKKH